MWSWWITPVYKSGNVAVFYFRSGKLSVSDLTLEHELKMEADWVWCHYRRALASVASVAVLGLSPRFLRAVHEFSAEFKLCLFSCKLSKLGCVYKCKTRILCSHVTSHPHEIHFSGLMSDRTLFLTLQKQTHISKGLFFFFALFVSLQLTYNVKGIVYSCHELLTLWSSNL